MVAIANMLSFIVFVVISVMSSSFNLRIISSIHSRPTFISKENAPLLTLSTPLAPSPSSSSSRTTATSLFMNVPGDGSEQELDPIVREKLQEVINQNKILLFMKGDKNMPQCGFSSRVAGILNFLQVNFKDVNVLEDDEIRQGIKDFSDWPTIPQLYVKSAFIGGSDIITEMTMSGELDQLFTENNVSFSQDAATKIREENS